MKVKKAGWWYVHSYIFSFTPIELIVIIFLRLKFYSWKSRKLHHLTRSRAVTKTIIFKHMIVILMIKVITFHQKTLNQYTYQKIKIRPKKLTNFQLIYSTVQDNITKCWSQMGEVAKRKVNLLFRVSWITLNSLTILFSKTAKKWEEKGEKYQNNHQKEKK